METDKEAAEFITKGKKNRVTQHATFVSEPKIKPISKFCSEKAPPSLATAHLWPQQLQSHSVARTEMPFAWPAITTDANDKGCQNLTSSAELSCMEDDCDLKIYCY